MEIAQKGSKPTPIDYECHKEWQKFLGWQDQNGMLYNSPNYTISTNTTFKPKLAFDVEITKNYLERNASSMMKITKDEDREQGISVPAG